MDRAGGYASYLALCEDARAYDDVVIALDGEYQAQQIRAAEARLAAER